MSGTAMRSAPTARSEVRRQNARAEATRLLVLPAQNAPIAGDLCAGVCRVGGEGHDHRRSSWLARDCSACRSHQSFRHRCASVEGWVDGLMMPLHGRRRLRRRRRQDTIRSVSRDP